MRKALALLTLTLLVAPGAVAAPTLKVFPDAINLETSLDHQSLVVQLTQDDGITRDVTAEAQLTPADAKLLKIEKNVLRPAADGTTTLTVKHGDQTVSVPVTVKDAAKDRPTAHCRCPASAAPD